MEGVFSLMTRNTPFLAASKSRLSKPIMEAFFALFSPFHARGLRDQGCTDFIIQRIVSVCPISFLVMEIDMQQPGCKAYIIGPEGVGVNHCPDCGKDVSSEWSIGSLGHLQREEGAGFRYKGVLGIG